MNYLYKYIGENITVLRTGTPSWARAKGMDIKLPASERYGLLKHIVGVAVLAGAVEKATGFDFSQLGFVSITKQNKDHWYNVGDENWGLTFGGVLNIRPNPTTSLFIALKNALTSEDDYIRSLAVSDLKRLNYVPIPYSGIARKALRTAEGRREPYQMFMYKKYTRPKAKKTIELFPKPKQTRNIFPTSF